MYMCVYIYIYIYICACVPGFGPPAAGLVAQPLSEPRPLWRPAAKTL